MVDLVSKMHNHWDGFRKTSVGRLRHWYTLSNWVLQPTVEVPSSVIELGLGFSWEILEERAHWKVELQHPFISFSSPNYITEASSRSVIDCFNFNDNDDLKKLNGTRQVWEFIIPAPPCLAQLNFLNEMGMRIILNKWGRVGMGATRPVAIPKHNNPSFPILYKTLIYPFAFYGLDIVSTWWSKAIKLFDIILELKTDCFVVGVTIIYIYIYIYMLTLAWLSWERTIGLLWMRLTSLHLLSLF